jgi:hypothetical protein
MNREKFKASCCWQLPARRAEYAVHAILVVHDGCGSAHPIPLGAEADDPILHPVLPNHR